MAVRIIVERGSGRIAVRDGGSSADRDLSGASNARSIQKTELALFSVGILGPLVALPLYAGMWPVPGRLATVVSPILFLLGVMSFVTYTRVDTATWSAERRRSIATGVGILFGLLATICVANAWYETSRDGWGVLLYLLVGCFVAGLCERFFGSLAGEVIAEVVVEIVCFVLMITAELL
jgi:hypothetical protein